MLTGGWMVAWYIYCFALGAGLAMVCISVIEKPLMFFAIVFLGLLPMFQSWGIK